MGERGLPASATGTRCPRITSPLSRPLTPFPPASDSHAGPLSPYLALRRSLFLVFGASTIVCVLVRLWMVVMQPCLIPSFSCTTLTTGARQLVVQEAAVTMWSTSGRYAAYRAAAGQQGHTATARVKTQHITAVDRALPTQQPADHTAQSLNLTLMPAFSEGCPTLHPGPSAAQPSAIDPQP